jgi:hypothetical protein
MRAHLDSLLPIILSLVESRQTEGVTRGPEIPK